MPIPVRKRMPHRPVYELAYYENEHVKASLEAEGEAIPSKWDRLLWLIQLWTADNRPGTAKRFSVTQEGAHHIEPSDRYLSACEEFAELAENTGRYRSVLKARRGLGSQQWLGRAEMDREARFLESAIEDGKERTADYINELNEIDQHIRDLNIESLLKERPLPDWSEVPSREERRRFAERMRGLEGAVIEARRTVATAEQTEKTRDSEQPVWIKKCFVGQQYKLLSRLWNAGDVPEKALAELLGYKEHTAVGNLHKTAMRANAGLAVHVASIGGQWSIRQRKRDGIEYRYLYREPEGHK